METVPWKVSLHGGHSGEFCEHAVGTLRQTVEAAVASGFSVLGLTEHAPRTEPRFLYASERAKGYSVERLKQEFEGYAETSRELQEEFRERLPILRGFETEVVPSSSFGPAMRALRAQHRFDYTVGSVHHVGEIPIDVSADLLGEAVVGCGGFDPFMERYFELVREMGEELRPAGVAHLDLPKLHAPVGAEIPTARVRRAAQKTVDAIRRRECILDLNTAAWRKGLPEPFPSSWLIDLANDAGVPFCFGDDSHGPAQVGFAMERARQYLLAHGTSSVTCLEARDGSLTRREIPLLSEPGRP